MATVLTFLASSGVASAGTVQVTPAPNGFGAFVSFAAAWEERNDVVLSVAPGGVIEISDRGAPLEAGDGCAQLDPQRASCTVPDLLSVSLSLFDGDDRYAGPGSLPADRAIVYVGVDTGHGADVVRGGVAHERIANFEGDDVVSGGAGDDSYAHWGGAEGVQISLDGLANDGPPGAHCNVAGDVENLQGGPGPDTLIGDPGPNSLMGGEGDDVLVGGDGNDELTGGPGNDRIDAGAGDDRIFADEGWLTGAWVDEITCGDGADYGWGDDADVDALDCEDFITPARPFRSREPVPPMPAVRATAYVRRGSLFVRLRCAQGTVDCAGTVAVTAKRTRLARERFKLAPGRAVRLRMPLTRRGHRLLRTRSSVRAVARFTAKGSARTARLTVRRR